MPLQFPTVSLPDRSDPNINLFLESCRTGEFAQVQETVGSKERNDSMLAYGLQEATIGDQVAIMRYLLENGAIMMHRTVYAAKSKAALEALLDHGLDVSNPMPYALVPLISVATKDDPALLQWFLSLGANPNLGPPDTRSKGFIDANDPPVPTSGAALEEAARFCGPAIIDVLVRHGTKIENSLALHHALMRNDSRRAMMEHLLRLGIDINRFGYLPTLPHGGTALHVTGNLGLEEEAQWLLEHGADPRITNDCQMTAAGTAFMRGNHGVERVLDEWAIRSRVSE